MSTDSTGAMTGEAVEPFRKTVVVNAPQAKAFRVFTERVDAWWPREHHIGKTPLKKVIIEPKVGGRWYSTHEDGSEADTGRVLAWEPPGRLLLSWQITAQWQFDPSFVTEVEVNFISEGENKTRVEFEHRNLERFGESAKALSESIGSDGGWPMMIERFAKLSEEG